MKKIRQYFDRNYWSRKNLALWAMLISGIFVLIEGFMDKNTPDVITVEPENGANDDGADNNKR